jgi:hypothetical protein
MITSRRQHHQEFDQCRALARATDALQMERTLHGQIITISYLIT